MFVVAGVWALPKNHQHLRHRSGKNILDTGKHKYNGHEKVHVSYVQKRVGQHATNVFHWPALLVTSHSKLSIQQIYVFFKSM